MDCINLIVINALTLTALLIILLVILSLTLLYLIRFTCDIDILDDCSLHRLILIFLFHASYHALPAAAAAQ